MMPVPLWEPCRSVAFGQIVLTKGFLKQTTVDLAERDGQRLLLILVFHQRADVLQQTLIELGELGIDLAGTLGRENGQSVLGVRMLHQIVDRRIRKTGRGWLSAEGHSDYLQIIR